MAKHHGCVIAALLTLVAFSNVPVYLHIGSPTRYGDIAFWSNYTDGEGAVLGMRAGVCFEAVWQDNQIVGGQFERRYVVNVPYDNIQDAMAGRPAEGVRYWWWYVKYSNGRLCGPAGWTWN